STGVVTVADAKLINADPLGTRHTLVVEAFDGHGGVSSASFTVDVLSDDQVVTLDEGDPEFASVSTTLFDAYARNSDGDPNNNLSEAEIQALMQQLVAQVIRDLGLPNAIVILIDPVDFIVTDPQGRQAGFSRGTAVADIPGTYHSSDGTVQLMVIPQPVEGTYSMQLAGVGTGDYRIAAAEVRDSQTTSLFFTGDLSPNGSPLGTLTVSLNFQANNAIPIGLGLASTIGGGSATVGVVGALERRVLANAALSNELALAEDFQLDTRRVSPLDQVVDWIVSAQEVRRRLVQDLFKSLESPFGDLLNFDRDLRDPMSHQLLDIFWKRLGQSLTGVPTGVYQLGDMLESLLPQRILPARKTLQPVEEGSSDKRAPNDDAPETKRSANEPRSRTAPSATPKSKRSTGQQPRPQPNAPKATSAQSPDAAPPRDGQPTSALESLWRWFVAESRRA
ncbi:MAG TPA: hypothetical protein VK137_15755, partial [Planctomycetaceae bacterium]|nr:hypothetical protein [Planctomycetaceae bacterium]